MNGRAAQYQAAATYNTAAGRYEAAAARFWGRFGQRTIERLALCPGDRVLDVCCGSGSSALRAAEHVGPTGHVLGVDLADRLLALARRKAKRRRLANIEFRRGDFTALDDLTRGFDAAVCVFGIFFCPDMARALAHLSSSVRPGGRLAVTTWGARLFEPASTAFWEAVHREAPGVSRLFRPWERIVEPAQLRRLFDSAGVPGVEVESEPSTFALHSPEEWWSLVLGSGYRGALEELPKSVRRRVRERTLEELQRRKIRAIEANVLYATARKASRAQPRRGVPARTSAPSDPRQAGCRDGRGFRARWRRTRARRCTRRAPGLGCLGRFLATPFAADGGAIERTRVSRRK
jgi:ubiquinone/menaquinone biosynthesis C-methylase UbiE